MFSFLILASLTGAFAFPSTDKLETVTPASEVKIGCGNGIFSPVCLKRSAISLLERLNAKEEVALFPGVSLIKDGSEQGEVLAKSLTADSDEKLDKVLLYQMSTFLDTHSVKLRLLDDGSEEKLITEGRKRKRGGMGGILAMAAMMKGTLMSIGLGGIALLAGKALMTALMSLLLSAIIGIKSLSSGGKSTTYEIVSKPIYTHSHSHSTAHEDVGGYGHSGYGRNLKARRR